MKKIGLVFMFFSMLLTISSCGDDNGLVGTKWLCYFTEEEDDRVLHVDATMLFESESSGSLYVKMKVTENGSLVFTYPEQTNPFTYTYDGNKSGTITTVSDGFTETAVFSVDGNEMVVIDSEDTMTFVKQ